MSRHDRDNKKKNKGEKPEQPQQPKKEVPKGKYAPGEHKRQELQQWKVVLYYNPNLNQDDVIESLKEIGGFTHGYASTLANEAQQFKTTNLLLTHRERAELYLEQFKAKSLTILIEPA